jgi:hypothetical protein
MNALLKILKKNNWLWVIYQITFDSKTNQIEFRKDNPLPKDMTDFLKKSGVSISKEERKALKNLHLLCKDYLIFCEMNKYIESSEDNETEMVQTLLAMAENLHIEIMTPANFFICFMEPTKTNGQFRLAYNQNNQIMFDYYQNKILQRVVRTINLFSKHAEQVATWYDQTFVITQVFSPLDKKYTEWFPDEVHASHYLNTKESYFKKAQEELNKMLRYLEPPLPPTKDDKPTFWSPDWWEENNSGDEVEPEWRDPPSCSAEPHDCRCEICFLQNLKFCNCLLCLQKKAVNAEIITK